MLKNSPLLLAGSVAAALLMGGCSKSDTENADTTPAATPPRPTKPTPGAPGVGTKPAPPADKSASTAAAKPDAGKGDPFAPKGGSKAGADKGKMAGAKGADKSKPSPATPAAPGGALGGAPTTPGAPGTPAAPKAPGTQVASVPKHPELDPFKVTWHKVPPPPYVFGSVQPLRLASADVEIPPPGDMNIREVASRRVSGIMSGDGVFAILEGADGGEPEIVKPGSSTRDGYRVVSITSDSVKLQRKDGNVIRTQIVPLTDASTQQASAGLFGNRGNGGGFPGSGGPGGFPGSGGFGGSGGNRQRPGLRGAGGVGAPGKGGAGGAD